MSCESGVGGGFAAVDSLAPRGILAGMNESERVMVGFEVSVVALPTPESSAARLVVRREHEQSVDLVQANAGHVFCTRERLRGENVQPR